MKEVCCIIIRSVLPWLFLYTTLDNKNTSKFKKCVEKQGYQGKILHLYLLSMVEVTFLDWADRAYVKFSSSYTVFFVYF